MSDVIFSQFCKVLRCNTRQGFPKKAFQRLYNDQFGLLDDVNWKAIEKARVVITSQDATDEKMPLHTAIECNYLGKGIFYPGSIATVHDDGTYDINYVDGVYEYKVESKYVRPRGSSALIVVDVQNDWVNGSLAVHCAADQSASFLPVINSMHDHFDHVIFSQDWHPREHCSFYRNVLSGKTKLHSSSPIAKAQVKLYDTVRLHVTRKEWAEQIMWPAHCIKIERGSSLHADLWVSPEDHIIKKGENANIEEYSAFGNLKRQHKTKLFKLLKNLQVTDVYVCGIATELGVKYTALDALQLDFTATIVEDACQGMNKNNVQKAMADARRAGCNIASSKEVVESLEKKKLESRPDLAFDPPDEILAFEETQQPAGKDDQQKHTLTT